MKTIVSLMVVALTPWLMLSTFSSGEPLHYQLASDPTIAGKGKDGQCMDYAISLSSKLTAKGTHGQLVFYRWHILGTHVEGSHVFVLYRLPDNTEWIVDNEIPHPKAVPVDASLLQLVFLLSSAQSPAVEVDLQDALNHLSYF
jgi:hypothetical protein